ncbi:MAG: hypothetical protein IPO62_11970 [Saprospiraceae bacterium]|nr:hypothetical protein [Saprospiraceae bacterium]MBK9631765.1 hypothetical protein [Saprospiraceae bacterium]
MSCSGEINIKSQEVIKVTIYAIGNDLNEIFYLELADKNAIKKLIKAINNSQREPIKVLAKYKLELVGLNSTQIIFVAGDIIKLNGISYRSKINLNSEIENLVNNI